MKIFLEFLVNIFYIYSKVFGTFVSGFLASETFYFLYQANTIKNNPQLSDYTDYGSFFNSIFAGLILGVFLSIISLMKLPSFSESTIKFKLLFSVSIVGLNILMGYSTALL